MDKNDESSSSDSMEKSPEKRMDSIEQKTNEEETIRKTSTICTDYCSYSVIKKIANVFNMKIVGEHDEWDVCWTDYYISSALAKNMKRFQKINHFLGMSAICRKDRLARNLNRMLKLFPKDYDFFPKTWCLTADIEEVLTYSRTHPNTTYIFKPDIGCQGKDIFLTKTLRELKFFEKMICQVYISKPLVIDGLKFDFRIYVLITSCNPLRIYVYNEGLARFATSLYCEPAADNSANVYMHLTNYSVNKDSEKFVVDDKAGSKRRISTVNAWLNHNNYDVPKIWAAIDDIIVKTVISVYPKVKRTYRKSFPSHKTTYACFELLGFDVLLDNKLKPHLLEVNQSPSFNTETDLDKEVKESLLKDTFRILNLSECDKKRLYEEDKQRAQNKLMKDMQKNGSPVKNESPRSSSEKHDLRMKWEESHLGKYRQVYPSTDADKYSPYFNQTHSLMFKETVTSRARSVAGKLQREEFDLKMREETARMSGKNSKSSTSASTSSQKNKLKNIITKKKKPSNSFDSTPIVEEDEKKGLPELAQKESLLSSCRALDQTDSGENTKETMLKPPSPINLTNEATNTIRPGVLPVSTERPTTLGRKTTNTLCPSGSL